MPGVSRKTTSRGRPKVPWEYLRQEIYETYIRDDKTLEQTIAHFDEKYEIFMSPETWKNKIKMLGIQKNETKKRAREEENSDRDQFGRSKSLMEAEKAKKRRTSSSYDDPEYPLQTPRSSQLDFEGWFEEQTRSPTSQELPPEIEIPEYHFPRTWSYFNDGNCSSDSDQKMVGVQRASMLEAYLTDEDDPSGLSHQFSDNKKNKAKIKRLFAEIDNEFQEQNYNLDLLKVHSMASENPVGSREKDLSITSLTRVFDFNVTLMMLQETYGGFSLVALKQEFEVAQLMDQIQDYEEAEYHCRRILRVVALPEAQLLLGRLFMKSQRREEAVALLFSYLGKYIASFSTFLEDEAVTQWLPLQTLWNELVELPAWNDAQAYMVKMVELLQDAHATDTLDRIALDIVLHGLSLAILQLPDELTTSSQHMFQEIFASLTFDNLCVTMELYGNIFLNPTKWTSGAECMLKACNALLLGDRQNVSSFPGIQDLSKFLEEHRIEVTRPVSPLFQLPILYRPEFHLPFRGMGYNSVDEDRLSTLQTSETLNIPMPRFMRSGRGSVTSDQPSTSRSSHQLKAESSSHADTFSDLSSNKNGLTTLSESDAEFGGTSFSDLQELYAPEFIC